MRRPPTSCKSNRKSGSDAPYQNTVGCVALLQSANPTENLVATHHTKSKINRWLI
ncbi:MAG: hypothetical protein HC789_23075 [Microcoleus sp. CSU_2_2]|nr:hypothetical protein [Microcoleus sp. CSU_2_2]